MPHPDGPSRAVSDPTGTVRSTASRAVVRPYRTVTPVTASAPVTPAPPAVAGVVPVGVRLGVPARVPGGVPGHQVRRHGGEQHDQRGVGRRGGVLPAVVADHNRIASVSVPVGCSTRVAVSSLVQDRKTSRAPVSTPGAASGSVTWRST